MQCKPGSPGTGVSHPPQETANPLSPSHFQVNTFGSSCIAKLRKHTDQKAKGTVDDINGPLSLRHYDIKSFNEPTQNQNPE